MITIYQPEVISKNGKSRLSADLIIDDKRRTLWFEVDMEYEKYLCYERSDAFLVACIYYAMRNGHDITCVAPVTQELLFNLNQHLIPALCKSAPTLHHLRIFTSYTSEELENDGGIGTGMSCGVDSFHTALQHIDSQDERQNLTHLVINDIGSFNAFNYGRYGVTKAREEIYTRARQVAALLDLPLIETDSNFYEIFRNFMNCHTYSTAFTVMALQKLWSVYYIASSYEYHQFSLDHHETKDSAYYDLLSLNCFSTRQLRFYCEGGALGRAEKTAAIVDFPLVQQNLHVCHRRGYNCGICKKCRRTMLTIDALGKLDEFSDVFPVDNYNRNLDTYIKWLEKNALEEDEFCVEIVAFMHQLGKYPEVTARISEMQERVKLTASLGLAENLSEQLREKSIQIEKMVLPLTPSKTSFPNKTQKRILALFKPFIRLTSPLEHLIWLEYDPSDFCASLKKKPYRLFVKFLSCFGPKPVRTGFNKEVIRKFLSKKPARTNAAKEK